MFGCYFFHVPRRRPSAMQPDSLHLTDTFVCPVITEQVAGGIVVPASGRLIACLGVDDLVIVDTNDALLITTRARSQEVKKIVKKAKESGWKTLL